MSTLFRRPILAFLLGAALVGAAGAGTAAYAALSDERVAACYVPKTGALYVVGRDGAPLKCADGHLPIDWAVRGPQGPAGVFSGTFTSPNGAYSISVTDTGIVLSGPGSAVRLTGTTVAVESAGAITLQAGTSIAAAAGTNLALSSGSATTLQTGSDLAVGVGGATSLAGSGDVTIESTAGRATLRGAVATLVESSGPVTVKGASATVQAVGATHIKGALVDVNGSLLP
ncbi:MAG TPA: hypothetical protein VGJ77_20720 [Gaiellaceae bacterium]|jgi:hypothetical protein